MTTSDETDAASALGREIERLANQYFTGVPGPALNPTAPVVGPVSSPSPPPLAPPEATPFLVAPPNPGPSALAMGAGGASPLVTMPPIPGPMHRPPLAATPMPKESDLRNIPALLADTLGTTPVALVSSREAPESSAPYFLELAGVPGAAASPSALSLPQPGLHLPTGHSGFAVPEGFASAMPSAALPSAAMLPAPLPGAPVGAEPKAAADVARPAIGFDPGTFEFRPELVPDAGGPVGLFDPHVVKRDFPILRERVHGRPLVWLDNAATTQKPRVVIERLTYFYEHENSNVHRAAHALAARATDAYEGARDKVRRFLNAPSVKEIVFTRGATEAINLVAQSWGRRNVRKGDEIVITWLEHHANIVPWQQLCSETGARLRVAPVDDRGQVKLDEYEKLLGPKTRLVSITQVSNALGTVVPAQEMVEMARRHGACTVVDGAQAVSHMPVDVQQLGCDFYVFSGHKVFAPTGIGVLFGKAAVLDAMPPWQGGGNMIADVTFEKTTYQQAPWRFEAGTGNIADAVGLGAAVDYVTALGRDNIRRYEHELLVYAEQHLNAIPGLRMIGTAAEKAGVLSFVLDGVRTEEVGAALDQEGIAARSGHHCAQPILRRFGLESTVRASLAPYNTTEDIDALVAALRRIRTGQPPRDF